MHDWFCLHFDAHLFIEKIEIAEMIKVLEEMKETTIYGEFKSDKVEIIV